MIRKGTQIKPAFWMHSRPPSLQLLTGSPPNGAEDTRRDDDRHDKLHDRDPEIAETGVQRQRIALGLLGVKIGDVGH